MPYRERKPVLTTGRYDQQIDSAGRANYWRLYVEVKCPDCDNIFWANYATMHMNGKNCPKCGILLDSPGRVDEVLGSKQVDMPEGGFHWGDFARAGDAGSAVLDENKNVVGLLFAGTEIEEKRLIDGELLTLTQLQVKLSGCPTKHILAKWNQSKG